MVRAGAHLGSYEVVGPLGAGGMGEVWRARDTRLGREVALKFLPPDFAEDPERHVRFEREAKLLASLNHPNIAVLYGLEHLDGQHALAMELVDGEGLDARIARGPVPVDEAIPLARQIADALEAAHEKGIVHRDLKPANVKVRADGTVKVLDFGLAKAWDEQAPQGDLAFSPTITGHYTRAGVILGTAAYMSPEQARGKAVDKRADIWAFGVVLYEMLTGRKPFDGETASDTLASVLRQDVDLSALPAGTPASVRRVLERCLQRDPRSRLRDIGDAPADLGTSEVGGPPAPAVASPRAGELRRRALAWVASAAACAVGLAVGAGILRTRPTAPLVRASLLPPVDAEQFLAARQPGPVSVSPDGTRLVFAGRDDQHGVRLWLRRLDSLDAVPLAGTEDGSYPFWAPNGRSLGFFARGKLKRLDFAAGSVMTLCDAPFGKGGAWNDRGVIVFSPRYNAGLFRIPAQGGVPVPVTRLDSARRQNSQRFPQFLPDGEHFLFLTRVTGEAGRMANQAMIGSLAGGEPKVLLETPTNVAYASGFLIHTREHVLVAQRFDPRALRLEGEELPIAENVSLMPPAALAIFSVSQNGVLVYRQGESVWTSNLVWCDREGKRVATLGPPGIYQDLALSPDGRRVAVEMLNPVSGQSDLWLLDTARGIPARVTAGRSESGIPLWMPDGRNLVFRTREDGSLDLFRKAVDEPGDATPLVRSAADKEACSVSPDGRFLAYRVAGKDTGMDVWVLPLDGNKGPYPLLESRFDEQEARFSPDGKWIAFQSDETGRNEVYVMSFPQAGERLRVSSDGGVMPRWSADGRELYYRSGDLTEIMAVGVRADGASLGLERPARLFRVQHATLGGYEARDGRFLLILDEDIHDRTPLTLVLNWTSLAQGGGG